MNCRIDSTLYLIDLRVDGTFSLEGSWVGGSIDLTIARIGGQLVMSSSTLSGELILNGLEVGDSLFMVQRARFNEVDLTLAKIGGNLAMSGSTFTGMLIMDGIRVGQNLLAQSTDFPKDQGVKLVFSRLGGLDLSDANISEIDLTATTVVGKRRLGSAKGHKPTKWVNASKMVLRNVTVGAIQDADSDSWPKNLELEGFSYSRLGGFGAEGQADIATRDCSWFVQWLERDKTLSPQPYEQLAKLLSESGRPSKAIHSALSNCA